MQRIRVPVEGALLSVTDWRRHEESAGPSTRMPLLFVAGWASTDRTWDLVLPRLVDHFDLYYLASREKPSCRLDAGRR